MTTKIESIDENENRISLSENQITTIVKEYIEDKFQKNALLINGQWGSGKTYFVKNKLIHEIETDLLNMNQGKAKIIYISLFGISNTESIYRQIAAEVILGKEILNNKAFKITSNVTKQIFNAVIDITPLSNLKDTKIDLSDLINFKENIIFIDDIERCSIDLVELFGFINGFIEHDEMKVILIANEDELESVNKLDLNKLALASNPNIKFNDSNLDKSKINNDQSKSMVNVEFEQVKWRVEEYLKNESTYKKIKEKLVGRSLYFYPNQTDIIISIMDNEDDFLRYSLSVEEICQEIESQMKAHNHLNLRTVHFIKSNLCIFLEKVKDCSDRYELNLFETVIRELISNIIVISIEYKKGKIEHEKPDDDFNISYYPLMDRKYLSVIYKFVINFVETGYLGEDEMNSTIVKRLNMLSIKKSENDQYLSKLRNSWFEMTEGDVIEQFKNIYKKLKENGYSIREYEHILFFQILLNDLGIEVISLDEIINQMEINIRAENSIINTEIYPVFARFDEESPSHEFRKAIFKINNIVKDALKDRLMKETDSLIDLGQNWTDKLIKLINEKSQGYYERQQCISLIPLEILVEKLLNSNSFEINQFRFSVSRGLYRDRNIDSFFPTERKYIEDLINKLEKALEDGQVMDKIKIKNLKYLIEDYRILL